METKIIGREKTRDGETASCNCCDREIKHLVYLSDGRVVGKTCAIRVLGFAKETIETAPLIHSSPESVIGFYGLAHFEGRIVRVTRGYATGGRYTAPQVSEIE